jgi:hypothetical protein
MRAYFSTPSNLRAKLEQAGFSPQQAEAVADSLKDALTTSQAATKPICASWQQS